MAVVLLRPGDVAPATDGKTVADRSRSRLAVASARLETVVALAKDRHEEVSSSTTSAASRSTSRVAGTPPRKSDRRLRQTRRRLMHAETGPSRSTASSARGLAPAGGVAPAGALPGSENSHSAAM